ERSARILRIEERAHRRTLNLGDPTGSGRKKVILLEQRGEERNEEREREDVEHRRDHVAADVPRQLPLMRPEEGQEPPIGGAGGKRTRARGAGVAHGYRRGVSSDTGRMHSSGVTPPCRNEPRYRLWYSRSFVGYTKNESPVASSELAPSPRRGSLSESSFVNNNACSGFSARRSSPNLYRRFCVASRLANTVAGVRQWIDP